MGVWEGRGEANIAREVDYQAPKARVRGVGDAYSRTARDDAAKPLVSNMLRELYDIIENEKHLNSNTILLSIDYSKAFDTLSTDAIIKALEMYGFGEYFTNWIKTILSNRTCCARNGGYISQEFSMERGVRQGCPISPILFILTSELFAASVRADPKIKGIKLPYSNIYVKLLHYADDITLLLKDLIDFREVL